MARFNSLGDRIKAYEKTYKHYLNPRSITIIRIDGKSFSKWTSQQLFEKPFDYIITDAFNNLTEYLVNKIQGCKLGYTQSDEITLILTDYDTLDTDSWFSGNIQKIVSVVASTATAFFNNYISKYNFNDIQLAMFYARVLHNNLIIHTNV